MKQTLSTQQIADALKRDENANWSWQGSLALAEYLEQYEEDTGEELELDVVAIRCDYSEFTSLQDWALEYFGKDWRSELGIDDDQDDDAEIDDAIRTHINDNGQLIEFKGGIIVSSF